MNRKLVLDSLDSRQLFTLQLLEWLFQLDSNMLLIPSISLRGFWLPDAAYGVSQTLP